jgi:hypothetical protein
MKRLLPILVCLTVGLTAQSQDQSVSIGTTEIHSEAILWLEGNGSQGLVLPVASTSGFAASAAGKGSMVFDPNQNKVFYSNGTAWIEVGGGTTGGGTTQTLSRSGNTINLSGGGGEIPLAFPGPSQAGQLLMWNGTEWITTTSTVPPSTGQVLKWNGSAWEAGADNSGSTPSVDGATIELVSGALQVKDGGITNAKISSGISASKIAVTPTGNISSTQLDAALTELQSDIDTRDASVTNEIQNLSTTGTSTVNTGESFKVDITGGTGVTIKEGTNIQIDQSANTLTINSTATGTGTVTSVTAGAGLTGGTITSSGTMAVNTGTGANQIPQLDGTGKLTSGVLPNAAGDVTGAISNLQIASGAVTGAELAAGAVTDAKVTDVSPTKLTAGGATTTGQVLKWNQTTGKWEAGTDGGATYTAGTGISITSNQIAVNVGTGANQIPQLDGTGKLITSTLPASVDINASDDIITTTTAAGDVTGTFSGLTVTGIQGHPVSNALPADGQILKWSSANSQFQYTADQTAAPTTGDLTTTTTGLTIGSGTGAVLGTGTTINVQDATAAQKGLLIPADYTTFNSKVGTTTNPAAGDITGNYNTGFQIAPTVVGNAELAPNAVQTGNIADGTIGGTDLATNITISTTGNVTAANFTGNGSGLTGVTATVADGSITGGTAGAGVKIAAVTITDANINASANIATSKLNAAVVVAGETDVITSTELANNSVTTNEISDGTIGAGDLASNITISTTGNVTAANFTGNGSGLTGVTVADGTITGGTAGAGVKIAAGTITDANINASANIATSKLNAAVVVAGESDVITSTELANNSVTTNEIADNTISGSDLSTSISITTTGDITTNAPGNLSIGGTSMLTGATTVGTLAGSGTRMVVADDAGLLGTQALPSTFNLSNSVPKGDGTGMTSSLITDDGSGVVITNNNTAATLTLTNNTALGYGLVSKQRSMFSPEISGGTTNGFALEAKNVVGSYSIAIPTGTASAHFLTSTTTAEDKIGISAGAGGSSGNKIGVHGRTVGAGANYSFWAEGSGTDTNTGYYANVNSGSSNYGALLFSMGEANSFNYGITTNAQTMSGTANQNIGGAFQANGSANTNFGVYGYATGGTINWAGYFDAGNVAIVNGLAVGAALNFGSSGQVLTSQGPGLAPQWSSGAGVSAGSGINISGSTVNLGGVTTGNTSFTKASGNNYFEIISEDAAINTKAGFNLRSDFGYTGTQYEVVSRKSDAVSGSGASDFVISKLFSTAGGNIDMFRIDNNTNNVVINGSKTSSSSYGNFLVSNGNVGIGNTTPHAPLQFATTTANRKIILYETADNDHQFFGFGSNGTVLRYQVADGAHAHVFYAGANATTSGEIMRMKSGYVSIGGTTSSITPYSVFDVTADLNAGYAGMYMNATDPDGWPFYGYAVNGVSRAWTWFNGTNGKWQLNTGGSDRITVQSGGEVGIGTSTPTSQLEVVGDIEIPAANDYKYSSAKTNYLSIHNTNVLTDNASYFWDSNGGYAYISNGTAGTAGSGRLPFNVPHGATITNVVGYLYDNDATYNVSFFVYRHTLATGSFSAIASGATTGQSTSVQQITDTANAVVDNSLYSYYIVVSSSQANSNLRMYGFRVTYTVTSAD